METKSKTRKYCVECTYNIESESATKALDSVMAMSPVIPIAFSVEPIIYEEDEEDD